jgi:hypothetical protein
MQTQRPRISFTFPYRWLSDPKDRQFLSENLVKSAAKSGLFMAMHPTIQPGYFASYIARLKYHAWQPVKIKLTKNEVEEAFKPLFGEAKCVGFDTFFMQNAGPGGLPVMEMEIYY